MKARELGCFRTAARVLTFALLVFGNAVIWACSCVEHPVCDPHRYRDADFIGEVVSKRPVSSDGTIESFFLGSWNLLYQVRVIESFRGPQKVGDIVDVHTGMGGGDCGFRFEIGHRYFVDALSQGSTLLTSICSPTAPVDRGQRDIRLLRKMAAHERLPDLAGVLWKVAGPDGELVGPLAGIPVSLQANHSEPSTVVADETGYFQFDGVPRGDYEITLKLPNALSPAYSDIGQVNHELLPPVLVGKSGDGVCNVEIIVGPSASISGVIKFPDGKQAEGWVNADTIGADGRAWNTVQTAIPDPDGSFRLEHLNPGKYQIQFTRRQAFIQGEPQVLDLSEGERKSGIVLIAK